MLSSQRGPLLRLNTGEAKAPPSSLRMAIDPDAEAALQAKSSRLSISVFRYGRVFLISTRLWC